MPLLNSYELETKGNLKLSFSICWLYVIKRIMNYAYLTPPSKVKRVKLPKNYLYENVEGNPKRRIFAKPPYEPFELEHIAKLKDYLSKKSPYMSYSQELLLRLSYSGNFLLSEVTEKVKLYDEWHENQVITHLQKPGREILEHGHIYAYGRDYDYCPVIVVRVGQINLQKYSPEDYFSATANLLDPLEKFMLVGGVIEKCNVVIDFESKKCAFNNYELLTHCLSKIAAAYPYRLKRMLIVNSIPQNEEMKSKINMFMQEIGSDAIVMSLQNCQELGPLIPSDEREKRYGGSLTNLCEYWPIHTTNKYEESQSGEGSDGDYKTVTNDVGYFQQEKPPFCDCGSGKCLIY